MSGIFTLSIETGNAAFGESLNEENAEIARILREVAAKLENCQTCGPIRDANGNTVGAFTLTPDA